MQYILMTYHEPADRNCLETALRTLRQHNDSCVVVLQTDNAPTRLLAELSNEYGISIDLCPNMAGHRAGDKVDWFADYITKVCEDGDQIIVADIDLYFLGDPFDGFDDAGLDGFASSVGITTRGYDFWCPINGGMFYFVADVDTRAFLAEHVRIMHLPWEQQLVEFPRFAKWRRHWGHVKHGLDWAIGQDYMACRWMEQCDKNTHEEAASGDGPAGVDTLMVDVTNKYNFCPATEKWGRNWCKRRMLQAMAEGDKVVLHLKSSLKEMLYDGTLPLAVTRHERGKLKWK